MGARPAHGRRRKRHRRASISQQASAHDASVFAEFVKQVRVLFLSVVAVAVAVAVAVVAVVMAASLVVALAGCGTC